MEISSGLLFLGHLIVLTYGHPTLKTPESVTGTWKGDVKIQCIYDPLRGYKQVLVKWLVRRGSNHVTIFLRDSTGDHIQLAKYRGRLKVSHNVPGDVSLQLNTLQMDDRNDYTCEVTWQTPDGNQVLGYKIIELRVQKYNPPKINTEAFTTMHSSLEPTTIMSSTTDLTTNRTGKLERTTAGSGRNLPVFAIIFIISLCCIVAVTIPYILFRCRTFQQEYVYGVSRVFARETSSSEETTRGTTIATDETDSQALISDYSDDLCLSQEYQITTRSTMSIPAC
ncbi:V-set and immunoglobulin domain-containing protein 4 [Mus pahari]|uniref:V-set and immunoglobulin domain-containing protein 4 n=1 Tax=Mus pahari TaxID=10093 RepID=UPI000A312179|nr:V-set and immunoglobulin domain-containing protein 4 [Mus pahari]